MHAGKAKENGKLKSETALNGSDALTDHSDNASEVSDEGYRSLGIVHNDKTKNRASIYSQNSVEDVDENGKRMLVFFAWHCDFLLVLCFVML